MAMCSWSRISHPGRSFVHVDRREMMPTPNPCSQIDTLLEERSGGMCLALDFTGLLYGIVFALWEDFIIRRVDGSSQEFSRHNPPSAGKNRDNVLERA